MLLSPNYAPLRLEENYDFEAVSYDQIGIPICIQLWALQQNENNQ